jgi:hypothetical protein
MKLHQIICNRLITQSAVIAVVGRNQEFAAQSDQYAVRPGGLLERDPYPGVVVLVPNQTVTSDLSDVVRMLTADVVVRVLAYDHGQAYQLADACAYNGPEPNDNASGLDGWRDISKGIQSTGLQSISEQQVDADDGTDRLLWLVEYLFSCDWNPS